MLPRSHRRQAYPVVRRRRPHPSPKFLEWVAQFGPTRLARALGMSRSAIHAWVTPTGRRRTPRMQTVLDIVALSAVEPLYGETQLTVSDILGESRIQEIEVRDEAQPASGSFRRTVHRG